ncbi:MAG: hypothetical protein J6J21_06570 [Clostridia bacterium]|nr:hypothetical protein [Clostridia bacterium]
MQSEELQKLRELLIQHYDDHPVAMLATDECGRVLWRNHLARRTLPSLKQRTVLTRRLTGSLPRAGESACVEIAEEHYLVFSEPSTEIPLYFLQLLVGGFREEFASFLGEYERALASLSTRTLALARSSKAAARTAYLNELGEHLAAMEESQKLFDALKTVRPLHAGRVVPVSAGELVHFFSESLCRVRPEARETLRVTAENGVVALLNFRDFLCALLNVYSFFESFVLSNKVNLSLRRDGDGECIFEFSGEDRHNVLSLYRLFCRRRESDAQVLCQSAIFFPLFCAMERLMVYRHRVSIFHREGMLCLQIAVRTTLEFPTLVVRRDEEEVLEEWACVAARMLLPVGITEKLRADLATCEEPLPLLLFGAQKAHLFD